MDEFFKAQLPDTPTPLNSRGGYDNAAGDFNLKRSLTRKVKSRKDLDQPKRVDYSEDDAMKRYYGDFSLESKRHVWDLLRKHPLFGQEGAMRMNRIQNNTREVLPNDPLKLPQNGGFILYEKP
jgi:hypothetical protein